MKPTREGATHRDVCIPAGEEVGDAQQRHIAWVRQEGDSPGVAALVIRARDCYGNVAADCGNRLQSCLNSTIASIVRDGREVDLRRGLREGETGKRM